MAYSSKTDWNTPSELIFVIKNFFGWNVIDLDPCSNANSIVGAKEEWTLPEHDGLKEEWHGKVFVNPPFDKTMKLWVDKAFKSSFNGAEVIMLLPVSVGSKLWQDHILPKYNNICFLRGRLKFIGATDGAKFDCALIYFGDHSDGFAEYFEEKMNLGHCIIH